MLGAAAVLAACRQAPGPAAAPVAAVAVAPASAPASTSGPEGADPASYEIVQVLPPSPAASAPLRLRVLAAESPQATGLLRIQAIEVQREAQVLQRIEGLDTQTPLAEGAAPVEAVDMNFDGHVDLRLVESRPAGPNTPYLNWLWNPAAQRFEASPALDEISAPRFDASRRQVQSDWRDGASRYGTDTYVWRDGPAAAQLLPLQREERVYSAPGRYVLKTYRWSGAGWQLQSSRPGRDG